MVARCVVFDIVVLLRLSHQSRIDSDVASPSMNLIVVFDAVFVLFFAIFIVSTQMCPTVFVILWLISVAVNMVAGALMLQYWTVGIFSNVCSAARST